MTDYAKLTMQFQWLGAMVTLFGLADNNVSVISSKQLKRLQATKDISAFYHLELSNIETGSVTEFSDYSPILTPLLQRYHSFKEPQDHKSRTNSRTSKCAPLNSRNATNRDNQTQH